MRRRTVGLSVPYDRGVRASAAFELMAETRREPTSKAEEKTSEIRVQNEEIAGLLRAEVMEG